MKTQFQGIRIIALLHQQVMIFVFRRKIHTQQLMNTQLTQQGRRRIQKKSENESGKNEIEEAQNTFSKKQKQKRKPDIPAQPLIPQVVSAPHSTERREQVYFQINQNEILLSLPVIQEEIRMELTMQNNKTQTQILTCDVMSLNRKKLIKEL
ncbi:Hypothetical_protein [Hexamita inflata]|uniref:Hypothetical_protein n=1 Tax=Hexamita inflata TaxID=28002 RepID=A0AA86NCD3_9EUKA|nr:Hypothetical protein HINF_LOCUS4295 [Hexamita inflata]